MKKTLFSTAIASLVFMASCQHAEEKKTTEETSAAKDSSTVEDLEFTTVEVEESASDIQFIEALHLFKEKKNESSAMYIEKGIEAYKKETAHAKGELKATAEANVAALQMLAGKVKKNEVKDATELELQFEKAERIVAHTIMYTVEDIAIVPDTVSQSERYFSNALAHLKSVVHKDKSKAKKEGEELEAQGDKIEDRLKAKQNVAAKDIKDFYAKSKKWIEARI
ncbi:MAG: hypothetical protein JWO58_2146 [Chitinophagaceae bacterium]|nr:hypothetical protein [Chitinophagaceae bacterium]